MIFVKSPAKVRDPKVPSELQDGVGTDQVTVGLGPLSHASDLGHLYTLFDSGNREFAVTPACPRGGALEGSGFSALGERSFSWVSYGGESVAIICWEVNYRSPPPVVSGFVM